MFGQLFINQPFGKYLFADFASNLFRNFNVFLKQGESKISSSMQHNVPFMHFSTIVECFPAIKFWLLYIEENIKLCI